MTSLGFSWRRTFAMMIKEFVQMRRDQLTFAMMVGIPLLQLVLFGFAINSDPRRLPTAVLDADHGTFGRAILAAMQASNYFEITGTVAGEAEAEQLLAEGKVQFVISIPADFSRKVARGDRPALLVEADATDPAATSGALAALAEVSRHALDRDLSGPLASLKPPPPPVDLRLHRRYNQEGNTQYNIVPGLMGVVLTMTMAMMTALAVTRERERGTMENLLVMPVRPMEVMLGKIAPYVVVGYIQVAVILVSARLIFQVPIVGSLTLLTSASVVFIAANLAIGFTFSTIAKNQMQAMQMSFFFFLPSILLSGFMFPFRGMPGWAQTLGELLPLTHFLRVVRGIMLKGNGPAEIAGEVGAMALILVVVSIIAMVRYRETLD
ncbi:mannose-1-phosphate guanyltransferase [Paramagnetospirillum marisnigri]|uniref:Mannose-1-phosphate guanyltransferase n=1 Tax=Paramagnetospirillum marisnigri TaxID=1285242 RepID=A0A178MPJ2_9PROT|nr:ABC transporter permease [Paramagnetospirillum marisnigri]OAN50732.1 mannose-1-phosphate guanyltransferase [Paramagnetospirillum marisnigri]